MRVGVIIFPGSNCDRDTYWALDSIEEVEVSYLWHQDCNSQLVGMDMVVLPGGFSYGDYLRTGAFARFSPIMEAVSEFSSQGGLIMGICNGFQILLEAGLLPGAMLPNRSLRFICDWVNIRVENIDLPFTGRLNPHTVLKIPIAHFEGNYFADDDTISHIESNNQVVFRYCSLDGDIDEKYNPNGSVNNIAGIVNDAGNVLGMMPHPERASDKILGSEDGREIFRSVIKWMNR
ncbi:phosphoribosylformylglycinamidine synthase I [bacterium]|nr:MAG: phosphoribosylformylglycinamidine synthase I [bacterium]